MFSFLSIRFSHDTAVDRCLCWLTTRLVHGVCVDLYCLVTAIWVADCLVIVINGLQQEDKASKKKKGLSVFRIKNRKKRPRCYHCRALSDDYVYASLLSKWMQLSECRSVWSKNVNHVIIMISWITQNALINNCLERLSVSSQSSHHQTSRVCVMVLCVARNECAPWSSCVRTTELPPYLGFSTITRFFEENLD